MNKQMLWRVFGAVLSVALVTNPLPGQTLTTLATFTGQNGAYPGYGPLVQGTDGLLYGVAQAGGANGAGVIYRIMIGGTMTIVYSFCSKPNCADGQSPWGGLTQAADDYLYGTTAAGGASGQGTIFKLTLTGTLTTMHSFDGTESSRLASREGNT
ncbi:MAG TPA: choice-of-anchor tandem repeat GloVer-containing protein [Bryobacteraceae bacterium]|nr:choice-of-anchor tandem repeat GloVer-containing protein [Bryobacteraceae bacterium]